MFTFVLFHCVAFIYRHKLILAVYVQKKNLSVRKPLGGAGDAPSPRDTRPTRGAAPRNHEGDVLAPGKGRPMKGVHDIEYERMLSGVSLSHIADIDVTLLLYNVHKLLCILSNFICIIIIFYSITY